jgi:hypothetical protein
MDKGYLRVSDWRHAVLRSWMYMLSWIHIKQGKYHHFKFSKASDLKFTVGIIENEIGE